MRWWARSFPSGKNRTPAGWATPCRRLTFPQTRPTPDKADTPESGAVVPFWARLEQIFPAVRPVERLKLPEGTWDTLEPIRHALRR